MIISFESHRRAVTTKKSAYRYHAIIDDGVDNATVSAIS